MPFNQMENDNYIQFIISQSAEGVEENGWKLISEGIELKKLMKINIGK